MQYYQVDAFSAEPHRGNPAAVCILTKPLSAEKMQAIAAETNQPATAFVRPHEDPFANKWRLRWFTPTKEYDLCGHATLAAAYVLWSEGIVRPDRPIRFQTEHHLLTCTYDTKRWIKMRFPAVVMDGCDSPTGLFAALGVNDALYIGRSTNHYLIEVPSAAAVHALTPNFVKLAALNLAGVTITALNGGDEYDFVSRYFSAENAKEDPVTGTSHCRLAPYWATKLARNQLVGYQDSARGGTVRVEVDGDEVVLAGQAAMVIRGELIV